MNRWSWSTSLLAFAVPLLLTSALRAQLGPAGELPPLDTAPPPERSQAASEAPESAPHSLPGTLPASPDAAEPAGSPPAEQGLPPPSPASAEAGPQEPAPGEAAAAPQAASAPAQAAGWTPWMGALAGCAAGSCLPCGGLCLTCAFPVLGMMSGPGVWGVLAGFVLGFLIGEVTALSAGLLPPAGACLGGVLSAQFTGRDWTRPLVGAAPGVILGSLAGALGLFVLTWEVSSIGGSPILGLPALRSEDSTPVAVVMGVSGLVALSSGLLTVAGVLIAENLAE